MARCNLLHLYSLTKTKTAGTTVSKEELFQIVPIRARELKWSTDFLSFITLLKFLTPIMSLPLFMITWPLPVNKSNLPVKTSSYQSDTSGSILCSKGSQQHCLKMLVVCCWKGNCWACLLAVRLRSIVGGKWKQGWDLKERKWWHNCFHLHNMFFVRLASTFQIERSMSPFFLQQPKCTSGRCCELHRWLHPSPIVSPVPGPFANVLHLEWSWTRLPQLFHLTKT